MRRHLLVVGRSRQLHAKAARRGLRLSVLAEAPRIRAQRDLSIFDRIVGLRADAVTAEWVTAARVIHRFDPVHAVGGFNEQTQEHAAAIAGALGLPHHDAQVVRRTRVKHVMRARLRECGLDPTAAEQVAGPEDVAAFGAAHGYPLVLKPVDGTGSEAVSIIGSAAQIPAGPAGGRRMLAEEFLDGEEFSVEAFSERGRHRVICVTQKFTDPVTRVEIGHCVPAPLGEAARTAIEGYVQRVLDALGVTDGPTHTEIILTAAGPRVVETHLRLGGDRIVELVGLACGIDLDDLWIGQVTGETVLEGPRPKAARSAAVRFVTPKAAGVLERLDGAETAAAMPGVVTVEALREAGAVLDGTLTSRARGACVIATGDTAEEAVARAEAAAAELRFVVSCAG